MNEISANLVNDKEPDRKLSDLKKSFQPLEKLGTMIYIEQNGSEYYSTGSKEKFLKKHKASQKRISQKIRITTAKTVFP